MSNRNYVAIEGHPNFYRDDFSQLIYFRKRINGRQVTISTGGTSIKEAKKVVDTKLVDLYSDNPKAEKRKRLGVTNPLIRAVWEDCYNERAISSEKHTLENYNTSWKYSIAPFWGDLVCSDVTHQMVTKFESWYLKNREGKTYFNVHKHLGMLFRYMKKHDLIKSVPELRQLDEIIIKKTRRKEVGRVYTDAEIAALLDNAVNERTRLAVLIYRLMGMRKMELLSSDTARWDLKGETAEIWSAKNKNWRKIPIPPQVLESLKEWLKTNQSKFLFPAERNQNTHISSQVFDKDWTLTKKAAGLKHWNVENAARVHDLRHTFATQTAKDNWPVAHACHVLDMSIKEYQRTYVHVKADDVRLLMSKSFGGSL